MKIVRLILGLFLTLIPGVVFATTPNLILGNTILIQPASAPTPASNPVTSLTTSSSAILLGINNPVGGINQLESAIGRPFALHLIYPGWTSLQHISDNPCPTGPAANACNQAQADKVAGRIPVFAWNCGDTNYNVANDVNQSLDDDVINAAAIAVKNYGSPVLIRWNWEFNDNAVGEGRTTYPGGCYDGPDIGAPNPLPSPSASPTTYPGNINGTDGINGSTGTAGYFDGPTFVAAWRHIHNLFVAQGVTNVYWDWNPGDASIGSGSTTQWFSQFWPGNNYVDWIGFDAYDRTDSGVTTILDTVPGALPYPVPGQGAYPGATPYPTVTSTPNSAYSILTNFNAKPIIFNENGVHPDLNNSTPPPGGYVGAYQSAYFNGGTSPNGHTFISLEQVLRNHPRIHAYAYFDKNNSGTPPPIGSLDWQLFDTTPTGPFGTFANSPYQSLSATPSPSPSPSPTATPTTAAFIWLVPQGVGPILALETSSPQPLLQLWNNKNSYELTISQGPTVTDNLPNASHAIYTGCVSDGNEGVSTTATFATPNPTAAPSEPSSFSENMTVSNASNIVPGMSIALLDGLSKQEIINVVSISGNVITTDNGGFVNVHSGTVTIQGACPSGIGTAAWSVNELVNRLPNVLGSPAPTSTDSSGNLTYVLKENGTATNVKVDGIIYDDELRNPAFQTPPIEYGQAVYYAQLACSEIHTISNLKCITTPGGSIYQKSASSGPYTCNSSTVGWNGSIAAYDGTQGQCRQFAYLLPLFSQNIIANGASDIIDSQAQGLQVTCTVDCTEMFNSTYLQGNSVSSPTISLFGIGSGNGSNNACYYPTAIEKAFYDGAISPLGGQNRGSWYNYQAVPTSCDSAIPSPSPLYGTAAQQGDAFVRWALLPTPIPYPVPTISPMNVSLPSSLSSATNSINLSSSIGYNGWIKYGFAGYNGFAEANTFTPVVPIPNFNKSLFTIVTSPVTSFTWTDGEVATVYRSSTVAGGPDSNVLEWPATTSNTVRLPIPSQTIPQVANLYFETKCVSLTITATLSDNSAPSVVKTFTPPNDGNTYDGSDIITFASASNGILENVTISQGTTFSSAPCSGTSSVGLQALSMSQSP